MNVHNTMCETKCVQFVFLGLQPYPDIEGYRRKHIRNFGFLVIIFFEPPSYHLQMSIFDNKIYFFLMLYTNDKMGKTILTKINTNTFYTYIFIFYVFIYFLLFYYFHALFRDFVGST